MQEFKTYHPLVNFIYFLFVVGFTCFYMHPVCLFISFLAGVIYSVMTGGKKTLLFNLAYVLPLLVVSALVNPLFNHRGVTILAYFPSGNPLTFESILYGVAAAIMLASVICHFACYNRIMTGDKFIYLFGRIIPSLSLVLSMILSFVPRFSAQLKAVTAGQKCLGRRVDDGRLKDRIRHAARILSIMVSWALESTVDTADSMKSRGYGLSGRTAFSLFRFDRRDGWTLLVLLLLGAYVLIGGMQGEVAFYYYPVLSGMALGPYGVSVFVAYFFLCFTPVMIECWEAAKWQFYRRKI